MLIGHDGGALGLELLSLVHDLLIGGAGIAEVAVNRHLAVLVDRDLDAIAGVHHRPIAAGVDHRAVRRDRNHAVGNGHVLIDPESILRHLDGWLGHLAGRPAGRSVPGIRGGGPTETAAAGLAEAAGAGVASAGCGVAEAAAAGLAEAAGAGVASAGCGVAEAAACLGLASAGLAEAAGAGVASAGCGVAEAAAAGLAEAAGAGVASAGRSVGERASPSGRGITEAAAGIALKAGSLPCPLTL